MTLEESVATGDSGLDETGADLIFSDKFIAPGSAVELLKKWKGEGFKPVFAVGSFELLHIGSVRFAAGAAQDGERLLAGVYDDESVARIHGEGRPVMQLRHRLDMAAALEKVSAVTVVSINGLEDFISGISPYSELARNAGAAAGEPSEICSDRMINIIKEKYISE